MVRVSIASDGFDRGGPVLRVLSAGRARTERPARKDLPAAPPGRPRPGFAAFKSCYHAPSAAFVAAFRRRPPARRPARAGHSPVRWPAIPETAAPDAARARARGAVAAG